MAVEQDITNFIPINSNCNNVIGVNTIDIITNLHIGNSLRN